MKEECLAKGYKGEPAYDGPHLPHGFSYGGRYYGHCGGVYDVNDDDVIVSGDKPRNPTTGQLWYNPADSRMKMYYDNAWVEVAHTNVPNAKPLNDEERDELERLRLREQLRMQQA